MLKIKSGLLILFFLILFIGNKTSYPQKIIDQQILSGLEKSYNFNWEGSLKIFNSLIQKYPSDPRGYHYKSIIYLWYYLGDFTDRSRLDSFYVLSDKALELCKKKQSGIPVADLKYLMGAIYYNRAIAEARDGDLIQALGASNQMKNYLETALSLNPDLYDANLGLGLYNFALSQIPASLQWAASLVGIDADKEKGLEYVKSAVKLGKFTKIDAEFYLSQLYSRVVVDHPEARKLLKNLVTRFPENLLFNFSLAWVEFELNDLKASEKYLKPVLTSKDSLFPFVKANSELLMANILFSKSLYDSAITFYNEYLSNALNSEYKGFANYRIGLCYELLGNRQLARQSYEESSSGSSDIEEDLFAERKGDELLENPLDSADVVLIEANNLIKQNKLSDAKAELRSLLLTDGLSDEQRAESNLYLSEISFSQKKYKESLDFTVKALAKELKTENWIYSQALLMGAWNSFYLKNYTDARLFLLQIEEMDEFDYQSSILNKVYSLKRIIPKDKRNN